MFSSLHKTFHPPVLWGESASYGAKKYGKYPRQDLTLFKARFNVANKYLFSLANSYFLCSKQ